METKLQNKADRIRRDLMQEVGSATIDMIEELVEVERELTLLEEQPN